MLFLYDVYKTYIMWESGVQYMMLDKVVKFFTKFYPIFVIISAVQAYYYPAPYADEGWLLSWLLGIIMLSMGLTMTPNDFKLMMTHPRDVLIGVSLTYICMPLAGMAMAYLFNFPPMLIVGFILLGCSPAGTSTNVMTFLSKGDTVLSVTVSSMSILVAPVVMPLLLMFYAGAYMEVNVVGMFLSIVKIIIIPIILGLTIRRLLPQYMPLFLKIVPLTSVWAIIILIAIVTAMNVELIKGAAAVVIAASLIYQFFALLIGYGGATLFHMPMTKRKSLTFLNGIQNTALGVTLAVQYFDPMAAIPSAIVCVWVAVFCPIVANIWVQRDIRGKERLAHVKIH